MVSFTSDPRYQRALQKASAKGFATGNKAKTQALDSAMAAQQIRTELAFKNIGLQGMLHTRGLMMQDENLRLQKRAINKQIARQRDIEKAGSKLRLGTALGIGTTLWAGFEGRRRKRQIQEDAARQENQFNQIIEALTGD